MPSNLKYLLVVLVFSLLTLGLIAPKEAVAQTSPDVASISNKKDEAAHPALRIFSEFGMGTLFGTLAGGTSLVTQLIFRPDDIKTAFITSAILYPTGIACGTILGGYLTDSKSGYWEPFVGAFSGALIADITAYFLMEDYPVVSALLVLLTPIITSIVAMETSHYWKEAKKPSRSGSTSQTVVPLSLSFAF